MGVQQYAERLLSAGVDIATSGDNIIIAAPDANHYIAIDFLQVFVPAAVGVTFKHGSTNFGGKFSLSTGQSITDENSMCNVGGVLTCGMGEAFTINLDAAQQCSGFIRYRIVGE